MKNFIEGFKALFVIVALIGLLVLFFVLDFEAYRQRFPNAEAWTYFFKK